MTFFQTIETSFLSKRLHFIILIVVMASCSSTQFGGDAHCPAYLAEGDKVLLTSLPFKDWELHLENIRRRVSSRKVEVLYAPEEEFQLRASGILNPLDSVYFTQLRKKGITHLMVITEGARKEGALISSRTPFEMSQEYNPYSSTSPEPDNTVSKAEIQVFFIRLENKQHYSFTAVTSVSGAEIRESNGGRTNVNAGGLSKARKVALCKSIQRITKECL